MIQNIEGWGVDRDPRSRPGVPMEEPPHPVGGAHWTEPARQMPDERVLKQPLRKELTPVFGTAAPPKGLSGLIRRMAYMAPDHKTKHWLLLLIADRVDVMERLIQRFPVIVPAAFAGGLLARRFVRVR